MSHLSDIERIQIIMERERDGKTLSTIATRHHCTHATVRNILSRYHNTGEITGGKSSGRPHALSHVEKQKLDKLIKRKPTATNICL